MATLGSVPDDPPSIEYAAKVAYAKRVINPWAIASCVLVIGFLIPPLALAGTVAGWIGLRRSASPIRGGRRVASIGLSLGLLGLVLTPVEYFTLRWADEKDEQVRCRSQMSGIAQAVFMYANNNQDQLPPDLRAVAVEEDITPFIFVCPNSTDTPGSLAAMATPSHLSYFYLRAGYRVSDIRSPQRTVMIHESHNHFGGMNVAFYDGHMEFVPQSKASKVCDELRAGQNPPPALNEQ